MTLVSGAAAMWWMAAVVILAAGFLGALLQPVLQRRRATSTAMPPISLILPIKLVNPGFERAQASAFNQRYPVYEVLIGAAEAHSPALSTMAGLAAPHLGGSVRVLRSMVTAALSPKLNTLSAPLAAAVHDVVVTKDSNITLPPTALRDLVASLTPGVGLVCAVPVAVRADTLAGRIEAVLINRDARLLLAASAAGKGYGVGKVMAFRAGDLARVGGVAALGYTIAEDTALSRALAAGGFARALHAADATHHPEPADPPAAGRRADDPGADLAQALEPVPPFAEPSGLSCGHRRAPGTCGDRRSRAALSFGRGQPTFFRR